MNKRTIIAVAAASCAGLLAEWIVSLLDPIVRRVMGFAPAVDDSAARIASAIMTPILVLGFPVFCSLYILPIMRRCLGAFQMPRWRVPISAFLSAAIVWILFCVLLYSPRIDSIRAIALAIGAVVWWPVFAASCTAGYIIAGTIPAKKPDVGNKEMSQQPLSPR